MPPTRMLLSALVAMLALGGLICLAFFGPAEA